MDTTVWVCSIGTFHCLKVHSEILDRQKLSESAMIAYVTPQSYHIYSHLNTSPSRLPTSTRPKCVAMLVQL